MKSDLIRWVEVPIWNLQNIFKITAGTPPIAGFERFVYITCCWFQPIQIETYISSNSILWTSSETQIQMLHNHDSLDSLVPVQIQLYGFPSFCWGFTYLMGSSFGYHFILDNTPSHSFHGFGEVSPPEKNGECECFTNLQMAQTKTRKLT